MADDKQKARHTRSQQKRDGKPVRDGYDIASLVIQFLGVVGIVATIATTQWNSAQSGKDMTNAIGQMSRIATTMEKQQSAVLEQSRATVHIASAARQSAGAAQEQLGQNLDLAASQQRPVIQKSEAPGVHGGPHFEDGVAMWTYGFKNYGNSPAYRLRFYETLTVLGRSRTNWRNGPRILVPNDPHFSTAYARFTREDVTRPEEVPELKLRVRFVYSDSFGRRYEDAFCLRFAHGNYVDC
jgi:hypothetical protein